MHFISVLFLGLFDLVSWHSTVFRAIASAHNQSLKKQLESVFQLPPEKMIRADKKKFDLITHWIDSAVSRLFIVLVHCVAFHSKYKFFFFHFAGKFTFKSHGKEKQTLTLDFHSHLQRKVK